ncbi:MAG: T9SS type A sorting domain-containing protein, partial [Ferruginibacter sp.]
YQTDIYYDRPTRTFRNYGPDAGHTSWLFDASGNVLRAGDIIFSAEFSGSSITSIQARIWTHQSSLAVTPVNFNWGGAFDGDGSGAVYGYASILPKTAGAFYSGIQSVNGTWAGPFSLVLQDNSVVPNYVANQFMEISVNLSKLGIDPGTFSSNPCGTPFRRVLIKTRASSSFTAELKDFVWPFSMFNYPPVDAYTGQIYFCEIFPPTPIYVVNPNPTSIYTWSTTNGNIVGSNIGSSIIVDAPGTYLVTQQLHAQCLAYSQDSVTILFDSICGILDVNLVNFNVRRFNNEAELKWQVSNNKEAKSFEIEYSFNNRDFVQVSVLAAGNEINLAEYAFRHPLSRNNNATVFYRIRVNTRDGRVKYSNIIALRNTSITNNSVTIFPNPTFNESWLSYNATTAQTVEISIWDAQGKSISSFRSAIQIGENRLKLTSLWGQSPGVYFVKVKLKNEIITKKIFLLQ